MKFSLEKHHIRVPVLHRNLSPALFYEAALNNKGGFAIISRGALAVRSGEKTGRSPSDKRIVKHLDSERDSAIGHNG